MIATIFSRTRGMFSNISTEETVFFCEKEEASKGIRKIISAMKKPHDIACRFDSGSLSWYVERTYDDVENGTYSVNKHGYIETVTEEFKMNSRQLIKLLEESEKFGDAE